MSEEAGNGAPQEVAEASKDAKEITISSIGADTLPAPKTSEKNNQDTYWYEGNVAAGIDGVGGKEGGREAALAAREGVKQAFSGESLDGKDEAQVHSLMRDAYKNASGEIAELAQGDPRLAEAQACMALTVVHEDKLHIAEKGDVKVLGENAQTGEIETLVVEDSAYATRLAQSLGLGDQGQIRFQNATLAMNAWETRDLMLLAENIMDAAKSNKKTPGGVSWVEVKKDETKERKHLENEDGFVWDSDVNRYVRYSEDSDNDVLKRSQRLAPYEPNIVQSTRKLRDELDKNGLQHVPLAHALRYFGNRHRINDRVNGEDHEPAITTVDATKYGRILILTDGSDVLSTAEIQTVLQDKDDTSAAQTLVKKANKNMMRSDEYDDVTAVAFTLQKSQ